MGYHDHRQQAAEAQPRPVRCGIITVSDTRTVENDGSGQAIRVALLEAGHDVVRYEVVKDEPATITNLVKQFATAGCQVIVTNGGTGISRHDSTFEAIDRLLHKRLPGFGELFRMLSYAEIGAGAMLSRATAGIYEKTVIFCVPGAPGAVQLALAQLILPELEHIVWETTRS